MSNLMKNSKGIITVRLAGSNDALLLRALRLEALARHPEAFAADVDSAAADNAEVWIELLGDYASDNKGVLSVALADDHLIGMTGLVRGHWPKTRHSGTFWGVYVNPDWRGLHVAEAMINECVTWAQIQGLVVLKLGVITTNTSAIRCYARCGFSVYGIEPKVIYYEDVYYDELLMVKPI